MAASDIKLITTEDGSSSLYHAGLKETYHSFHGALQESLHVFIQAGLRHWIDQNEGRNIKILEVGMGTGLNVLLTVQAAQNMVVPIEYTTLEPFPLPEEIWRGLNYPQLLNEGALSDAFEALHIAPWEQRIDLLESFHVTKSGATLESFSTEACFNIVYYDAFAPNKQPAMWELPLLKKVADMMCSGGVFVTYCAKGQLKRDLASIGLLVETLKGPPGKMEMVRATKP